VLLATFGEEGAPPCGNCDTCLEPVDSWDGTEAARMALSAVWRTGQRFGRAHVTDVLRGVESEKVLRFGHDALPTFGVGADRDARAWASILRQLVAAGLLRVEVDRFGGLSLTEAAGPVLRGERAVTLRRDPLPPARARRAARRSLAEVAGEGAEVDEALFEALRAERTALARDQGVPPYVVFGDRTLVAMATAKPRALSDLAALHGVGDVKLARYGDRFLAIIRRHLGLEEDAP